MSYAMNLRQASVAIADFDLFLEAQSEDLDWELVDGAIVAMTNPTERHEQIAGNLGAPLKLEMRARHCLVHQGGIAVQSSDDDSGLTRVRPDIVVRCGSVVGDRNYITDPLVVVEVLSPSTMDRDRGPKLHFYQTRVPTLVHIVLVYQDQMRIEHYRRTDTGWRIEVLTRPEDVLQFEAVAFGCDLSAIYEGVTFAPSARTG
jgi:Uma2 family endonuclease